MNEEHDDSMVEKVKIDIFETLRCDAKAREDLRRAVKREIGIDISGYLDRVLGEHPDKKISIEVSDMPMREIAENVFLLDEEGYSPGQIAHQLGLWPVQITRILKDQDKFEKEIKKEALKKLPWYLRLIAKIKG